MHPVITQQTHPECYPVYQNLLKCRKEAGVIGGMLNKCNPEMDLLNKCLDKQYYAKVERNKSSTNSYAQIDSLIHQREQSVRQSAEKARSAEEKMQNLKKQGEKQ
jgi:hypothetical protein